MGQYDSILKEKKKYEDNPQKQNPKKNKIKKYIILDILAITIFLIISYVIYYQKILSPKNIFLYDIKQFQNIIEKIIKPLQLNFNQSNYYLEGILKLNENNYEYTVNREKKKLRLTLKNNENNFIYYLDNITSYSKVNNTFEHNYIEKIDDGKWNTLQFLTENLDKVINNEQFIKRLNIENQTPIVEVILILNKEQLNQLLGTPMIKDEIETTITLKNNALSDEIISAKIVINNKTIKKRNVITYQNNSITLTNDNGQKTTFTIQNNQNDFIMKIHKEDALYSVFTGSKKENSYQYSYQIIDKIYNLNLNITYNDNNTTYQFYSNISKDDQTIKKSATITNQILSPKSLNENIILKKSYQQLSKEEKEKYKNNIDLLILPIKEFINEHKESIN